jgi:drug/metabolite transporter (DMT)-like permease
LTGQAEKPVQGFFWMAASALLFSVMAAYIKRLSPSFSSMELVFHRSVFNCVLFMPILGFEPKKLFPKGKRVMVLRGFLGFLSLWCIFYSVEHLPISVATLLMRVSPVFVLVLSILFLKERLSKPQLWSAAIAVFGVVLALKPDSQLGSVSLTAAAIGLLGALFAAASYVSVRAATANFNSWLIVQYYAAISALGSLPFVIGHFHLPTGGAGARDLLIFALLATFSQFTMIEGYRVLKAGVASAMQLLAVPFSLLIGCFFLDERLSMIQWAGVFFLTAGVFLLTFPGMFPGSKNRLRIPSLGSGPA